MDRLQEIGAFVRQRRKASNFTQRQLAELAGAGLRFVSELERDKETARLDAVNRVLAVFGKTLGVADAPTPGADLDPREANGAAPEHRQRHDCGPL